MTQPLTAPESQQTGGGCEGSRRLRIGNVPEHFSSPLYIGATRGYFASRGVNVELVSCHGGTGEMVKMLKARDLDVAIALTEGLVSAIANGCNDFAIVGTYVDAPLTWAISTGRDSPHTSVESLRGGTIGISRYGSGSHIMSFVLADNMGWLSPESRPSTEAGVGSDQQKEENAFKFKVLTDFKGLRDGVNGRTADAFMWEHFTTKPYHDTDQVRRIGQIVTPWPAFLIAVRRDLLLEAPEDVRLLLQGISESCATFMKERESHSTDYVARTYGQKIEDVRAWFDTVKYPTDCSVVSESVLKTCVDTLIKAKVLEGDHPPDRFVDLNVASLQS